RRTKRDSTLSQRRVGSRTSRRILAVASAFALLCGLASAAPLTASAADPEFENVKSFKDGSYIVVMSGEPAAAYDGGTRDLQRTAPKGRQTYDSSTRAARDYTDHLRVRQDRAAATVDAEPYYNYTTALNGFAADLTADQASELSHRDDVLAVVK